MAGLADRLFGLVLRRKDDEDKKRLVSFAPPMDEDGSIVVQAQSGSGAGYGVFLDLEGLARSESELIQRYRSMMYQPEVNEAVNQIVNEAIVDDEEQDVVQIDMDEIEEDVPEALRDKLAEEFEGILDLLRFESSAHDIFRAWYRDGQVYFHAVIDREKPVDGIQELRYIDPRKIRRVREVVNKKQPNDQSGFEVYRVVNEYYVYSDKGFNTAKGPGAPNPTQAIQGVRVAKDSVCHSTSGLLDDTGQLVLSYLHVAIKVTNQLRSIEDAAVIYRLVRAPERRVWYLDVQGLPRSKAEQYIRDYMVRQKNMLTYDAQTGKIMDTRKFQTLYEDFYLARRGTQGTQVETIGGNASLLQMDDVLYFQKRLYKSLNVPVARLMPEDMYVTGRGSEISREEVGFSRFVDRLRRRFAMLFVDVLEKQLALKEIMSPDDFAKIRHRLRFKWARDNFFAELKDDEVLRGRADTLNAIFPYVGRYFSNEQVRRDVLRQTDDDIREIDKEIEVERDDPQYPPPGGIQDPDAGIPPMGEADGGAAPPEDEMPEAPKPPDAPKRPEPGKPTQRARQGNK